MDHFKLHHPNTICDEGFLQWRQSCKPLSEINPIGSMIAEDESRYLYWLTKEYFSNSGAVIDLGPLAGGSTHALALGLSENRQPPAGKPVHSYDLWQFWEGWDGFFPGKQFTHLQDIQSDFLDNLGPLNRFVVPHKGNICDATWGSTNVEILFIDAAKTPETMEHIVNVFYPALIPGKSIVIHQDFISAECPWIHATQEYLRNYFELVDSPDASSICFRPIRKIPPNILPKNFFQNMSDSDGDELIRSAATPIKGWYKLCVIAALAKFQAGRGNIDYARDIIEKITHDSSYDHAVSYDIELVEKVISRKALINSSALHK